MTMRSRLAQIVAGSLGPDGKPDRTKVFTALQLTPDAPEAILLDAYLGTEEGLQNFSKIMGAQATTLHGVFQEEATQLHNLLETHCDQLHAIKEQQAILFEELTVARAQAREKLDGEARKLVELANAIASEAKQLAAHSRRAPVVSILGFELFTPDPAVLRPHQLLLFGSLVGAAVALTWVMFHFRLWQTLRLW